ncbi:MAG: hypothetical protein AB7T49_12690 [Oligoflexales bacterium]
MMDLPKFFAAAASTIFLGMSTYAPGQTAPTSPTASESTPPASAPANPQNPPTGEEKSAPVATTGYLNYPDLSHRIELVSLRAGNHDEKENEYYFTVNAYSLVTQKVERKKAFKDRRKLEESLGKFGEIKLLPLSQRDQKAAPVTFEISGETLRQLVSLTMRDLNVREFEVSVLIEIKMFEKNKFLFFFGDDTFVGKTEYFIIEDTLPHQKLPGPKELVIEDTKGLKAVLKVDFAAPPAPGPTP